MGRVVFSKTGRDGGKPFVIVQVVNERYVIICDGDTRKIENPKMKNIKHLQFTKMTSFEVIDYLNKGEIPDNHIIKKSLKRILERGESDGKEVW
ncbi:Ribosomal protein L2 domain 2 [Syntrophomonas zehnderi OL-4]|uniref:Ribosomal protein L2 domain 2 n=1 Tax=Syntrophomonas zehnderi OL-4 TaxID=690567 RepID=A0A0E4GA50_9FIRM|nr:Ribosomal protein L2 domain 2 [Syntrophomonas zehnderi OL-4]CFX35159.1 Ribosomal protein L2 domain 2 [Syntrophomonas zehnderi OL-4]